MKPSLAATRIALAAAFLLLIPALAAHAATIVTVDGKMLSGDLKSIAGGDIFLETHPGKPAEKIPLADMVRLSLTWQERISAAPSVTQEDVPLPGVNPPAAATKPQPAPQFRFELAHNDHLTATLDAWTDTGVSLTSVPLQNAHLTVPLSQVESLWTANEVLAKKARQAAAAAAVQDVATLGKDIAYIEKDGDVKAVAGQALGVDAGFLKFNYDGQERKIRLERLAGLILAQPARPDASTHAMYQVFTLSTGDVLSLRLLALDGKSLRVSRLSTGKDNPAPFDIPLAKVERIATLNGRQVWLGDLKPASVEQTPYFDRLIPYRVDRSFSDGRLTLTDGVVEHGILVHAQCHLAYDIDAGYEHFSVKIGFQQPDGKIGRASVRILGDDKILWQDADMKGAAKPVALDLNVAAVKKLRLEVDFGKEQDAGDDVVWGDAKLIRAKDWHPKD